MFPHHSDQVSQRLQVSIIKVKTRSLWKDKKGVILGHCLRCYHCKFGIVSRSVHQSNLSGIGATDLSCPASENFNQVETGSNLAWISIVELNWTASSRQLGNMICRRDEKYKLGLNINSGELNIKQRLLGLLPLFPLSQSHSQPVS